jgi:ABC-2 type transport system ATP-binding protein
VIVAERLGKHFGDRTALADVTFRVARGEVVGFLGPNGAGKTTALRILAGVFPPSRGRATVAGVDVVAHPHAARRHVGYALERPALYPEMTVASLLAFVARLRGAGGAAVGVAIARARLEALADRRIDTLSKGMRQRVGLAVALVGDPPVLLLDEPTAGLDPGERTATRGLVRTLAPDHAILLSSHELGDVESCCDRIVVLHRGRLLADGPPDELATRLHAVPTIRVTARAPRDVLVETLARIPGIHRVVPGLDDPDGVVALVEPDGSVDVRAQVAAAVHAGEWDLLGLEQVAPSLEEVFLRIVGAERTGS